MYFMIPRVVPLSHKVKAFIYFFRMPYLAKDICIHNLTGLCTNKAQNTTLNLI